MKHRKSRSDPKPRPASPPPWPPERTHRSRNRNTAGLLLPPAPVRSLWPDARSPESGLHHGEAAALPHSQPAPRNPRDGLPGDPSDCPKIQSRDRGSFPAKPRKNAEACCEDNPSNGICTDSGLLTYTRYSYLRTASCVPGTGPTRRRPVTGALLERFLHLRRVRTLSAVTFGRPGRLPAGGKSCKPE